MHDSDGSHAMTEGEIEEIIAAFRAGARGGPRQAGFDGCELMAAYNALIEQFWSPFSNRRNDRFGGSFENRMRFSAAVLEAHPRQTAARISSSAWPSASIHARPTCCRSRCMQEIVAWHDERRLYDYVTFGTGSYFDFTRSSRPSSTPTSSARPMRRR